MNKKDDISISRLNELFEYNQETGSLVWKDVTKRRDLIGSEAGCVKACGYIRIQINGSMYSAHRIAWALHFGEWPTLSIDHINGIKTDNKISNLRDVSHRKNMMNSRIRKSNKCGFKGVYKKRNKYQAQISVDGKLIRLGCFETAEMAHQAYSVAAKKYHGEFSRVS